MTDSQRNDNAEAAGAQQVLAQEPEHALYTYESAGISERKGSIPVWLWIVVVSLLIWGGYYLAAYWNAPAPPA